MQVSEYLTPEEAANILRVSETTIVRKFEHRPGVLDLGTPETRFKRRYRVLRIPREALERYILEIQVR
jgi:hypothetical protein